MNHWHRNALTGLTLSFLFLGQNILAQEPAALEPPSSPQQIKTVGPAILPKGQQVTPLEQGKAFDKPNLILLKPEDILWKPGLLGLPSGSEMALLSGDLQTTNLFTLRIKMPLGYQIMPHWHMVDEHITVISGTFHVGLGEKFDRRETIPLKPGSYFVVPARINYFAWASEDTVIQINNKGPWNIHYIHFKDDPRTGKK